MPDSVSKLLRETAREVGSAETPSRNGEAWQPIIPLAETPTAAPFPLETLPRSLAEFANAAALAKNCPADFVAVPMLTIAGAAIGAAQHDVRLKKKRGKNGQVLTLLSGYEFFPRF